MATITTLATTENWLNSRVIINTNFDNINTELETATTDIWALETTVNTGALAGTSGTPSGTNKFVTDDDTSAVPTPNKVARYDSAWLLSGVPPQTTDQSYPAWETLSAWNVVFIENAPTTAQATSAQNIGDVAANTRVSFPVFGSGVANQLVKINLAKVGSPSVTFWMRIETDNAGSPSGTLVHASATGTFSAAWLTTDLVERTVPLVASITIPAGQKCHAVVFQWTYGSETVNASNYYKVGYSAIDTTTRAWVRWNGSAWWGLWAVREEWNWDWVDGSASTNSADWYVITALRNIQINTVTKQGWCNATRCLITWVGLSQTTTSLVWNVFTFSPPVVLVAGTNYNVTVDKSWASYTYTDEYAPTFPTLTNIKYVQWYGDAVEWHNISSINSTETSIPFPYTSSTLFLDKVLSKTDADYSYKIDWLGISQEAVTAGDLATGKYPTIAIEWIDSNQTGMTQGTTMYLGNTPWSIASSAGTNSKKIGKAITASKLQIYPIPL